MLWKGSRESDNIEDRRGMDAGPAGGGFGLPIGGRGGLGIAGVVVVAILAMVFGVDPRDILNPGSGGSAPAPSTQRAAPASGDDSLRRFVAVVLADTEDTWHAQFRGMNREYQEPHLVLFTGAVNSACGFAQAAVGPFYCPGDQRVYIDLAFYQELRDRFQAPGDFAQAYVIAHEVGHHVQNLLGISTRVHQARQRLPEVEANALSVRLELQADCFAGVWAYHAQHERQILEPGDIEEAINAASAIGDDRLQQQSRGYVTPDSFTHGSSAQRVAWFRRGFERGELRDCDTFNARRL